MKTFALKKTYEIINDSNFEFQIDSIDEFPSAIAATNVWNKIFKKSLIDENNITFPISIPAEDSVFLINALLNAHGIKFINKMIVKHEYNRLDSETNQHSKNKFLKRSEAYYMMYYSCIEKNKTRMFVHYLLFPKLNALLNNIMKYKLPPREILDILLHIKPLFKLYCDYEGFPPNLKAFEDIAQGNFENVLKGIYGETTPKLTDIKCIYSTKNSIKYCDNLDDEWLNQFEKVKPDLFVYDEFNINEDILHYCDDNNIKTVHIKENLDFESILDLISFNYIHDLKHIILFYHLKDIRELAGIKNHFIQLIIRINI